MAVRPLHTLEICSGVGMLGEGLRVGLGYLGIETRTVCHIEREAYAAAVLAARIEEGSLDPAPIWSDLLTFDAGAWRGAVDCIVAGFPCQDLSIAGRRAGLDGKRSGLFFSILDIADACGARFLALENVAGIATATAAVVDEAEGELEERAAARVLGELADRGWDAEWVTISASDVGASHGRARWFCWAWRREVGHAGLNARSTQHGQQPQGTSCGLGQPGAVGDGGELAHASRHGRDRQRGQAGGGWGVCETGDAMVDAGCVQRRAGYEQDRSASATESRHQAHDRIANGSRDVGDTQCPRWTQAGSGHSEHARGEPEQGCCGMAEPESHGRNQGRPEPSRIEGRPDAAECGCAVADTDGAGLRGRGWGWLDCCREAGVNNAPRGGAMADTGKQGLSQRIISGGGAS